MDAALTAVNSTRLRLARIALPIYWIVLATTTHWPRLDVTRGNNQFWGGAIQFDKLFHVGGFGLLAALLILARPIGARRSLEANVLVATLVAAAYAVVDEITQRGFHREVGVADGVASLIGVFAAAVIALSPGRAEVSGPRGWRITSTRIAWIVVAPVTGLLATIPAGGAWWVWIINYFTDPSFNRDKVGHFGFAVGLTWLLAAASPAGRRRPRLGAILTIALIGASAPVIEKVQSLTGREVSRLDVWAHQLGLLAALLAWWGSVLWWWWLRGSASLLPPLPPGERVGLGGERSPIPNDKEAASGTPEVQARSPLTPALSPEGRGGASEEPSKPQPASRFVGHAVIVGLLTFASRITGLVRDAVLAAVFGLGSVADAFFIGFLVPNLFRRLFGEGALSAAFIPHYTELLRRDPEVARRFASVCLTLLTVLLTGLTILGELAMLAMLQRGGWSEHATLAIELTMVMLPYMPLICLVALIGGVLQVHEKFGAPAAAPVLLNVAMIGGAAWITLAPGDAGLRQTAFAVAWSVLVAGVLQLAWQLVAMLRVTGLTTKVAGTAPAVRGVMAMMLPMVVGLAIFQLNAFADSLIAFLLAGKEGGPTHFNLLGWWVEYPIREGGVAALQWAQRLYQFPLGVFGIAVATAIFPALAGAAPRAGSAKPQAAEEWEAFARILRQGLRLTVFIGLPASVGLVMLRLPLSRVVYERGEFTFEDATRVASILAGYSSAIWAYSMTHVLTRGFYALKDSSTPLKVSVGSVGVNVALNATLIWPLGAAGLAWSTAVSALFQTAMLLWLLRERTPRAVPLVDGYVLRGWGRTAGLSAAMAAALLPFVLYVDLATPRFAVTASWLAGLVILGMAVVFVGAWATGAEELSWLKRRRRTR